MVNGDGSGQEAAVRGAAGGSAAVRGDPDSAHVKHFVSGHTRLLTARELEAYRTMVSNSAKGVGGLMDREAVSFGIWSA